MQLFQLTLLSTMMLFGTNSSAANKNLPPLPTTHSPPTTAPAPIKKKALLYVGARAGCNAGVVTTNELHRDCSTRAIGYTIDYESVRAINLPVSASGPAPNLPQVKPGYMEIFVGVIPRRNAAIVSPDINYGGAATVSIGYISTQSTLGGIALYVTRRCSKNDDEGEVSTNPAHKGCGTIKIGYLLPR